MLRTRTVYQSSALTYVEHFEFEVSVTLAAEVEKFLRKCGMQFYSHTHFGITYFMFKSEGRLRRALRKVRTAFTPEQLDIDTRERLVSNV